MGLRNIILSGIILLCSAPAFSSMTISGTRIVFPGSDKEVSVRTNNKGDKPALVQVWVDDGRQNEHLDNVPVPFIVTPPVYRVEPGKGQSIRMIYNGMVLPQDRESVFWFNMLEIPSIVKIGKQQSRLELAFRTRIKVFYRPAALISNNIEQKDKIRWSLVSGGSRGIGIKMVNPTPYYYSFDGGDVVTVNNFKVNLNMDMVAPFSEKVFYPARRMSASEVNKLNYRLLNDYGATVSDALQYKSEAGFLRINKS
jgi:chaperone protein EcpD